MGEWIDSVARALAGGASRREAVRKIGGGLVAVAAASLLGSETARAKPSCRDEAHPCEGNQECCEGLVCTPAAGPGSAKRCAKPACRPLTSCPSGACGTISNGCDG